MMRDDTSVKKAGCPMLDLDPLMLSRVQFAANITFHILFPSISIGLAWVLLFFKWRFNKTQAKGWREAYHFWVKIFALTFALGVVTGITMSFQFGTNWPGFMKTVGNIAGPLLAFEVLSAFFLEATFLAIMLYGVGKVSNRVHTLATILVAGGTSLSAFWILALNSWMQTPVGFEMIDGKAHAVNWLQIIFNPSFVYRLGHMMSASGITVAFLIAGISSYQMLRGDRAPQVVNAFKTGLYLAAVLVPLQIWGGDMLGLNTLKYQPAKIAAIEAVWETEKGVPLQLFAWPNEKTRHNDASIAIPKMASLILTHDLEGEIKGLNEFEGVHPPVAPLFWAFRIMVGMGVLMLIAAWWGTWQFKRRGTVSPFLAKGFVWMTFSGWVATVAGWYVTEVGRQPYLVYGVLKVADAVSDVPKQSVHVSLTLYLLLYLFLGIAYIHTLFYLARKKNIEPLTQDTRGQNP